MANLIIKDHGLATVSKLSHAIEYVRLYMGDDIADYLDGYINDVKSIDEDLAIIEQAAKTAQSDALYGDTTEVIGNMEDIIDTVMYIRSKGVF